MTRVKLGDKNIPFIYQGSELLYPNPVKDGLVLWYDFKGMKNSDVSKGVAKDLTNRSTQNAQQFGFLYSSDSGYGSKGLKFDGIDDRIIPMAKHPDGSESQLDMKKINNGQKFSVEISLKMSDKLITQGSEIFMTIGTYGRFWLQFLKDNNTEGDNFYISTSTYYGTEGGASALAMSKPNNYKYGDEFHICVTLDKNDELKLYVNGELKGERILKDMNIVTEQEKSLPVYMGIGVAGAYYRRFEHELYSLKIYDRILTDQEIQHNYQLEKERWGL